MNILQKLVCKLLDETSEKIKNNQCEVTQEDFELASKLLGHRPLSKEQACLYLNMSRSSFDLKVCKGLLPKGRKRSGFKELVWYLDELEECIMFK